MTNPYRAMCTNLTAALLDWQYRTDDDCYADLINCARALLAEPLAERPTDEELLRVAAISIEPYESSGITPGEYEPETECAVEVYGSELIAFARAVLARWGRPAGAPVPEPEAEGPSADELIGLALGREPWATWLRSGGCLESAHCELADLMLAVLARWGRPAAPVVVPVPVSERLPGPEDCDAEGRCWLWERDCGYSGCKWALEDRTWSLSQSDQDLSVYTHWLPFNALPLPAPEVQL